MRKSCLFQLVIFVVLVFVAAMLLRGYIRGRQAPQEGSAAVGGGLEREGAGGDSVSSQEREEAIRGSTTDAIGIEGLSRLPVSRLMIDAPRVRGLAVDEGFFYVSSFDPSREVASLYKIDRENRGVRHVRTLEEQGRYQLGGLHISGDSLLTSLSGEEAVAGSAILVLGTRRLEMQTAFEVDVPVRAVAQGADGLIHGFSSDAATFYAWTSDGEEVRRRVGYEGVDYRDMDFVQGSLVCVGMDSQSGVIDVIDPYTFTLLVRHRCYTRTEDQEWVTGRGFAFFGGIFYFAPEEGHFPTLMEYMLDGVTLSEYIPSVGQEDPSAEP